MKSLVVLLSLLPLFYFQDCFDVVDVEKGKISYTGEIGVTKTGRVCQRWDAQTPHSHKKKPENFPNKDLRENYCRDPDNYGYPWCFTTDPEKKRERCNIPDCAVQEAAAEVEIPTDCYKILPTGPNTYDVLYGGNVSETMRGLECQKWTDQYPNVHDRTPEYFPNKGLGDHNYCRDPDGTGYPWCYTTEPGIRWEGCSIVDCDDPNRDKCKDLQTGDLYTVGDKWSTPEEPCRYCQCFKDRIVDCFTLECGTLECESNVVYIEGQCCPVCYEPCMDTRTGVVYNVSDTWQPDFCSNCTCIEADDGTKDEICSSMDCAMLDEGCEPFYRPGECCPVCSEECRDDETSEYYPVGANWNPDPCTACTCEEFDGQKREFCASIYCDIPTHCLNVTYANDQCCPFCGESDFDECYDFTSNNTILYDGQVSTTESGKECQFWTAQFPQTHTRTMENFPDGLLGYHNYCRDPDNSGYLWCYTNEAGTRWERCDVPSCRDIENPENWDLEDAEVQSEIICQENYGRLTCPTDARIVVVGANYGATSEEQGCTAFNQTTDFCQSSSNTTVSVRDKCNGMSSCDLFVSNGTYEDTCPDIEKYLNVTYYCKPDVTCYTKFMGYAQYNGTRSETKDGLTCMRWNQQRPHGHYFIPEDFSHRDIGEHNYCRDPDGEGKPWCYTMDAEKRWDFCGVPECEGYTERPNMVELSQAKNIIRLIGDAKNIDCQYVKEGENKVTYIGQTNVTESGRFCQRWTETTPHFHTKMPERYPDAGLGDHNFCRDPDGNGRLWCYTMDPEKRFEFCSVEQCTEDEIEQMGACDEVDCGSGGDCFMTPDGETACLCKVGFIGINNTCIDIDECKRSSAVCPGDKAICVNNDGGFACQCPDGYYYDEQECKDSSNISDDADCAVPEFIKTPYTRYDVNLGDSVIIDCEADNNDWVYWTKGLDGVEINGTRQKTSSTLRFNSIKKKNIDIYRCVIENECTGLSKTAKVDIHAKLDPCTEAGLQRYGMVWDAKDWDTAFGFCNSYGLKFAVPRSKSESKIFIQDAWRSYHMNPNGKKFRDTNWIWIGANDRLEENVFTDWNGADIMAPKWWPSNPDNWKGMDPRGQDEIAFHLFSGYWDDSYGFIARPFACECNFNTAEDA